MWRLLNVVFLGEAKVAIYNWCKKQNRRFSLNTDAVLDCSLQWRIQMEFETFLKKQKQNKTKIMSIDLQSFTEIHNNILCAISNFYFRSYRDINALFAILPCIWLESSMKRGCNHSFFVITSQCTATLKRRPIEVTFWRVARARRRLQMKHMLHMFCFPVQATWRVFSAQKVLRERIPKCNIHKAQTL